MGPPSYSSPKVTPQRSATSRLLAMKFMNRLGPGDASAPATPGSADSSRTHIDASGRSSQKRRRDGADDGGKDNNDEDESDNSNNDGSDNGDDDNDSPSSAKRRRIAAATTSTAADMEATMRASLAEEERRRQAAVAKRAAELGDEHWTWSAPLPPHVAAKLAASTEVAGATRTRMPFAVVRVGYAEIDSHAAEAAAAATTATAAENRSNGGGSLARLVNSMKPGIMRFNMKETTTASTDGDEAAPESGQRPGSGKAARKAAAAAEKDKGKTRKKEAVKLKQLTSLSSQGGQNSMKCHRCGRSGHKAMECPSAPPPRRSGSKKR